jgi:hypothetical protein
LIPNHFLKAVHARIPLCLGLTALLVACDQEKKTTEAPRIAPSERASRPTLSAPVSAPQENFQKAAQQAESIASPEERNRALSAAAWDVIDTDPALARDGIQKMTAGSEEKNRLIEHLAMRLAEGELDEATAFAKSLGTEGERSLAYGKIALVLSAEQPERAAHLLSESGIASRDFDVAVVQVLQRWAALSPQDAAAWVMLFDQSDARSAGLHEVVSVWLRQEPAAAFAWIPGIPNEKIRREAMEAAAQSLNDFPENERGELLKSASLEIQSQLKKLSTEAGK